jgi:hypothetical protein
MDIHTFPWLPNSALSTWIARRRARIAAAKLDFQLFDKRLELFDAVRAFLSRIVRNGTVTHPEIGEYRVDVADAAILFDARIASYLESLQMKGSQLLLVQGQLTDAQHMAQDERTELVNLEAQVRSEIDDELKTLVDRFKPFLKI